LLNPTTHIAVVGATGVVGREVIQILGERNHPVAHLHLFGSERSAGSTLNYNGAGIRIQSLDALISCGAEYAVLCADADTARRVQAMLKMSQMVIVDNSNAFRMEEDVPLVIPEVNGDMLSRKNRIVANPNCSTIMMVRALDPLRRAFGIKNIIATTYQAVSGAGSQGLHELREQTRSALSYQRTTPKIFPCSCAFNVFEHESTIDQVTGFNGEETKMVQESRRIWGDDKLSILPTCVRVPVERAHSQSLVVDLCHPCTQEQTRAILIQSGINGGPPDRGLTPCDAAGTDDVMVGRIRISPHSNGKQLLLWVCCDQVRKGAALNALQIIDELQCLQTCLH
jgi:aspartate-semialdehyde dehydrogenase